MHSSICWPFTLGYWTIQLGALLFTVIDLSFPNPSLISDTWALRSIADDLASIIIAFPLFLLVTWAIARGARRQPERLESPVRKWLTWIALVITATAMLCDVVTFLAYLLRGDLDVRFVLKVITVFAIAGGVFVYYLDSLRRDTVSASRNRWFAIAALAAVLLGLGLGFSRLGSPATQRVAAADHRRLFDLSSFALAIHANWTSSHNDRGFALPKTLQEVRKSGSAASYIDPVSGYMYEYIPGNGTRYQLCATFSAAGSEPGWKHPAGHYCFALDAALQPVAIPNVQP